MNKWQQKEQAPKEFGEQFPEFSVLTRNLLWQRGLKTQKDIDEFFNPDYSTDLHDPFLLKNADKAVNRIFQALEQKERVMVYGDYDSDGVCGATIIYNALKDIGFDKEKLGVYMPDREKEGYGLKEEAVQQFIKENYHLIITIDCGTTSHKAIELANENNLDVIVIDHHRVIDSPPPAYAFVNPHQEDDKYPFKDLSGAGVAFKIVCALFEKTRKCGTYDVPHHDVGHRKSHIRSAPLGQEKWFLDLVAMATITDVMPLLGENRTLVKYGLFVMAQAKRLGLRALMEVSGVRPRFEQDSLTTNLKPWTLGFVLGPRLNAAGRMDHANTAFALLNAESYEEAMKYARDIDDRNRERQELVERVLNEVETRLNQGGSDPPKGGQTPLDLIIFEGDTTWPIGVAGLVAGKIADKYQRPAFIYQIKDNKTCAGSVRTIPGFHVVKALESVSDILINFGGHPQAGGFTVPCEKLDEMKDRIEKFARENLKEDAFIKKIEYGAEVNPEGISWEVYEELERFEPFGEANREPVFLLKGARVSALDVLGNGKKHLRLLIDADDTKRKAMAFGMGDRAEELSRGDTIDILFNFAVDEWNGNRELMLRLADFRVMK